ncbi:MAG: GGDEF domain-containing protein [Firmicutes bacterium]|nr:GGDEF domain-containing protein [Bacillota bacterium]
MRQFQFEFDSTHEFRREITKLDKWCSTHICTNAVFTIFSETPDSGVIKDICDSIEDIMPYALYMGCSSNGNIVDGALSKKPIAITCTVFEYPTTRLKMLQYDFDADSQQSVVEELKKEVADMGGVKAVEMLMTIRGMSLSVLCDGLASLPPEVEIFGGGAFNLDINSNVACVFTKIKGLSSSSIAFLLIAGEDFHIRTSYVTGWKPLGRDLHVTKAKGSLLCELDGKPAYDTYYRYLNIGNDENFFFNTLEFPFLYHCNDIDILRAPTAATDDGSLVMTSDIAENVTARIAYGDPWTILDSVNEESMNVSKFSPEIIHIYSCAARRTFWGNHEASNETTPFNKIAPVSGFYTSSEFLRTNGFLNQHNVTLVIGAMREGEAVESKVKKSPAKNEISGKISMVSRLATFIGAATAELAQANEQLELIAVSDGMTKLFNRSEIQRLIEKQLTEKKMPFTLVMLDIDNFKHVNDTYGHKEGDNILICFAKLLKESVEEIEPRGYAGRWGGEEFMLLLPGRNTDRAFETAEVIRTKFAAMEFTAAGHITVSIGVTAAIDKEQIDELYTRVDAALYSAKETGKNKTVIG